MNIFQSIIKLVNDILQGIFNAAGNAKENVKQSFIWHIKNKYRAQLKNRRSPYTTCFPTSVYMFMSAPKIGIDLGSPDQATGEIENNWGPWVKKNMGNYVYKKFKGNYRVLWDVQREYIKTKLQEHNKIFNVIYQEKTTASYIIGQLKNKLPVIVGISPKYMGKILGHIVLLVGYKEENGLRYFIIDDPFGNFLKYYSSHFDGNDVYGNVEEVFNIMSGLSLTVEK